MAQQTPLNVQCFVKKEFQSMFVGENDPRLLYVSKISPDASTHPRVMHAHDDLIELLLICSGSSEFLIHDKKKLIRPGDLLVYNAGVVHDEISGPGVEIGSYCVAIGGLHMPGLRENALVPDDAGYIFPERDERDVGDEDNAAYHALGYVFFKVSEAEALRQKFRGEHRKRDEDSDDSKQRGAD